MKHVSKPIIRALALLVVFSFTINFLFETTVNAAPSEKQRTAQAATPKQTLIPDIGDMPNKRPTTKTEI